MNTEFHTPSEWIIGAIPQRARPLKDHETCLIFQWSFNELSMISEVFHDSWTVSTTWTSICLRGLQNFVGHRGIQSFSGLSGKWSLPVVFRQYCQRSVNELSKVISSLSMICRNWSVISFFQNPCSNLGQSFRVLSGVLSVFQSSFSGLGQSFRDLDWSFKDLWQSCQKIVISQ